jgi:beta-glucosidase
MIAPALSLGMRNFILPAACCLSTIVATAQNKSIYHDGWIDFNKNGKEDIFEDPTQPVERRIADLLSQMTLEEKTCQTATLYGFGRVLKDELPTPAWKNEIWKDGIANIDEHLNGVTNTPSANTSLSYPFSRHAEAINTVQHWFIEQTRLGIPVDFTNEGIHGLNHDRATSLPAPIAIGSTWDKALVREAGDIVGREAKALGYTNVYTPILDIARDPRWGRTLESYGEDPYLIAELGKQMVLGVQEQGVASTLKHYAVYSVPKGGRDGSARTDPHVAPRELFELYLYAFRRVIEEAHPLGVMSSYNDWDGVPITGSYYFLTELLRERFGFDGYVVSDSEAVEYLFSKHHVAETYKDAVRQVMEAGLNVRTNFTPPQTFILPLREIVKEGSLSMATLDKRVSEVLRVKFRLGLFDQPYVKDPKAADEVLRPGRTTPFMLKMARESLVLLKNDSSLLPLEKKKYRRILVVGPLAKATSYAISRYGPSHLSVVSVEEGLRNFVGNAAVLDYAQGCEVADSSWPESEIIPTPLTTTEQADIDEAVAKARGSDLIVAVLGEDEKRVGEGMSRTGLGLPGRQEQLLEALRATGRPVVLVLINGQPLTINWANRYIPAILEAWFPNQLGGQAIAETLFGDNNPGGKLTITFPKTTGEIEWNFPYKPGSQPGDWPPNRPPGDRRPGAKPENHTSVFGPLYPFGYGLSYTTFSYSNLVVTPEAQKPAGDVAVTVDITNTGSRKGDEVVQLYVHDEVSSVTVYEEQLRGFERVSLDPGEKKTVTFVLHPDDLSLLDKNMVWRVEPGKFQALIGSSSADIRLKQEFEIMP